uniref:Reverse transcriptase domain-containing protein n=1 Tax=Tanacetum cinerariifolium TaxID=118510 RepID=A0A699JJG0_TANCI|nr:reverse transcriptase domain-containing protein [Tanacetum cinerariifolium]
MSTRSSARYLFPPLDNPKHTIQRRSRVDPTLLNDFEMATDGNGDPPVPDLQTIEELCQPSLNGRVGGTFMKRRPEECYDLIENMTAHHNDWDTSAQRSDSSSSITSSFDPENIALKAEMAEINKHLMKPPLTKPRTYMLQEPIKVSWSNPPPAYQALGYQDPVHQPLIPQPQAMTTTEFTNYMKANDAILKNMQTNMTSLTNSNIELKNMFGQFMKMNTASSSGLRTLPSNTITNPKDDLKGITTRSGTAYQGPTIPNTSTNYMKANDAILKNMQTNMTSLTNSSIELKNMFGQFMKMNIASSSGLRTLPSNTITNPKDDLKGITTRSGTAYQGPTIPNTSSSSRKVVERETEVTKDTVPPTNNGSTKDVQPLVVQIEIPIPNYVPVVSPVIEPVVAPNKLSLSKLTPTLMTLELVDRSISRPIDVTKDVFVKVGKFYFSADFIVVDFDADPRVPLILERSFLKTERALIDVYAGELTLRVNNEAVTFNLDQTWRYSANYNDMTVNQIDVIDMDCEEY